MTYQNIATRKHDLLKKGRIQISSLKATHIHKSRENLGFISPFPLFRSLHLQIGTHFRQNWVNALTFFEE